jgi:hypothetical protein
MATSCKHDPFINEFFDAQQNFADLREKILISPQKPEKK